MTENKNIVNFCKLKNINYNNLIKAGQVHGINVKIVTEKEKGEIILNTDGFVTRSPNVYLSVLTADCLPVSFFSKKICGIIHVGWRGLSKGIVEEALKTISKLEENVSNVHFNIGPGIGPCHFEVRKDVLNQFNHIKINNFIERRDNKTFLDIKKITKFILKKNGVPKIKIDKVCTFCSKRYFSYRRDGGGKRVISITNIN